jgi:hypothetical protein
MFGKKVLDIKYVFRFFSINFARNIVVKKFPAFMEPEIPSPYPQVPATCPYPEPTPSSPHDPLQLPEDPS